MNRIPMVVATNNSGKLLEIQGTLSGFDVRSPSQVSQAASTPEIPDPIENGTTYLENARLKATEFSLWSGLFALADDSGLEVDALDRRPGLHSARYAGPDCSPADNIQKMLAELRDVRGKDRRARFVCCLALCSADRLVVSVEGVCPGRIVEEPRGAGGFGYDPIFCPDGEVRTFAEMTAEEKKRYSHRGHALKLLEVELANARRHRTPSSE